MKFSKLAIIYSYLLISNNREKLKEQFDVYGRLANMGWVPYEKNNDYVAFFIRKSKKNDKNT